MEKYQWKRALLPTSSTLQDAIRNLNETALKIVLIVSDDGILQGTVTDGDIRRGLLRGLDLHSKISEVMFRTPFVIPIDITQEMVLDLMRTNKLFQIPVVDNHRRVIGLQLWDEVISAPNRQNLFIIMAGGQGTRLRPYTEDCPKPMLSIGNKPILEHIIERAKKGGFNQFILSVGYLAKIIKNYFGDGSKWDVEIRYIYEEAPLGTVGALSLIDIVPKLPFIVTNGDILTDIQYGVMLDFHERQQAVGTMAVKRHEWQHPYGVVLTKGMDIVGFEEKPLHQTNINAGIYVLDPSALELLTSREPCDMPTLFNRIKNRGQRTIVYPMHEPWLDIGHLDEFERAQRKWLSGQND